MAYGHGDLLARLGRCDVPWCPKPANGSKTDDGRRLCPQHALQELIAEEAEGTGARLGPAADELQLPQASASIPTTC